MVSNIREGKLYLKVMEGDDGTGIKTVIAICDAELLGKTFREGDKVLAINEEFFKGDLVDTDEVMPYLERAYTALIVGERAVSLALELGLIHPDAILKISGIPYAQIVRM